MRYMPAGLAAVCIQIRAGPGSLVVILQLVQIENTYPRFVIRQLVQIAKPRYPSSQPARLGTSAESGDSSLVKTHPYKRRRGARFARTCRAPDPRRLRV